MVRENRKVYKTFGRQHSYNLGYCQSKVPMGSLRPPKEGTMELGSMLPVIVRVWSLMGVKTLWSGWWQSQVRVSLSSHH